MEIACGNQFNLAAASSASVNSVGAHDYKADSSTAPRAATTRPTNAAYDDEFLEYTMGTAYCHRQKVVTDFGPSEVTKFIQKSRNRFRSASTYSGISWCIV